MSSRPPPYRADLEFLAMDHYGPDAHVYSALGTNGGQAIAAVWASADDSTPCIELHAGTEAEAVVAVMKKLRSEIDKAKEKP